MRPACIRYSRKAAFPMSHRHQQRQLDRTAEVARAVPHVRVIDEPCKGLVIARERARREARGDVLVYLDADCRAPISWLARIASRFERKPGLLASSGNYRFYDWDWWGRTLIRGYDFTLGPATHVLVKYVLRAGVVFYGGNFAVRREALERIGGFDTSIEFHGEDTNLGRRLFAAGPVELAYDCSLHFGPPVQRDGEGHGFSPLCTEFPLGDSPASTQGRRPP